MHASRGVLGRVGSGTLIVLLSALGAAATAAEPPGAETPEAAYGRFKQAFDAKDMAEVSRCLAPAGAAQIAMQLYFGAAVAAAMEAGDDEAKAKGAEERLDAILAEHGVAFTPEEAGAALQGGAMPASLLALADPGALVADLLAFATKAGLEQMGGEAPAMGELADLQIDGDTARATTSAGPIEFVRHEGRWFLGEKTLEGLGSGGAGAEE